jgi:hypothetical protein
VAYALCHPRENGDPVDSRLRGNDNWESRNDNLESGMIVKKQLPVM